jgi:hypothetical protein
MLLFSWIDPELKVLGCSDMARPSVSPAACFIDVLQGPGQVPYDRHSLQRTKTGGMYRIAGLLVMAANMRTARNTLKSRKTVC